MYLKQRNGLYHDVDIALDNTPRNLLSLTDNTNDQVSDSSNLLEEGDNPLDLHRFNTQETVLIPNVLETEEIHIAPGEEKQPKSRLNDEFCEELAFPYLFPKGKFGYKIFKEVKLSPVKYFTQWLLNYTEIFASDPGCIFLHYQRHNS